MSDVDATETAYAPSLDDRNNDVLSRIEKMGQAQQKVLVKEAGERAKLPPGLQVQMLMEDKMDRKSKQYVPKGHAGSWVTMDKEHMEAAATKGLVPVRDGTGDVVLGGKQSILMSRPKELKAAEIKASTLASKERLQLLDQEVSRTTDGAAVDSKGGLQIEQERTKIERKNGG